MSPGRRIWYLTAVALGLLIGHRRNVKADEADFGRVLGEYVVQRDKASERARKTTSRLAILALVVAVASAGAAIYAAASDGGRSVTVTVTTPVP